MIVKKENKKKNIASMVKKILSEKLNLDLKEISLDKKFVEDFGIDSFWALELMFELEENFGIIVPENERIKLKTVRDIINYIKIKS